MKSLLRPFAWLATVAVGVSSALAQVAPNAPRDQPYAVADQQLAQLEKAMAPYIASARQTYPAARSKFLAGLPPGEHFFVVARIHASSGRWEQVFIRVQKIQEGVITGIISSDVTLVTEYKPGQTYTLKESELIDWLISKRDGTEEGNVVGKFMDTYRP